MQTKPNFIGIGGQKCASTWISECLRSHPDIYMSSPKELRYFVDNEAKGLDWYLQFFEGSERYTYRGEFSSNYIYSPEAAEKIKSTLGQVKIIAVVRNPADRALSHIKHLVRDGDLPPISGAINKEKLEDILRNHPKVLSNSLFQEGLTRYRNIFGPESVFIVTQEHSRSNGGEVLDALWEFLEVSSVENINESDKVVSAGVNPKYHWLEKLRKNLFVIAKQRAPWMINLFKQSGLSNFYRTINKGREIYLSNDAAQHLMDLCSDDWNKTQELLTLNQSTIKNPDFHA